MCVWEMDSISECRSARFVIERKREREREREFVLVCLSMMVQERERECVCKRENWFVAVSATQAMSAKVLHRKKTFSLSALLLTDVIFHRDCCNGSDRAISIDVLPSYVCRRKSLSIYPSICFLPSKVIFL